MIKDRTFEFRSTVDTISGGQAAFSAQKSPSITSSNNFLDKATGISREFPSISAKLEQLSKIAKNRSIFDDKDEEFENLSNYLKRDLTLINKKIQELKNNNSGGQSSPESSIITKSTLEHQKNVALILQNWAAQSFKTFENVLEIRSQTLKSKKDRKEQFGADKTALSAFRSSTPPPTQASQSFTAAPSSNSPKSLNSSPLKQRPIDPVFNSRGAPSPPSFNQGQAPITHFDQSTSYKKQDDLHSHVSIDFSSAQSQQQQLQMEQQPLLGSDSRTLRVRNNALGAIESTMNELGSIYQQLAHMVAEQGETVQRIDFNIEEMNVNVLGGQRQLARYLRRVSSNRWLIAKMFIALILFIIVFKFIFL